MRLIIIIILVLIAIGGVYYFATGSFKGSSLPDSAGEPPQDKIFGLHAPDLVTDDGRIFNILGQQIG